MGSYLTPNRINIGVLGLWHLGCIYAASFAKKGFNVRGFDQNQKIINKLKKGIPPIFEPGLEQELKKTLNKKLSFSSFQETIRNADYIFITYDIPVNDHDVVNLKIINQTFKMLAKFVDERSTIVISSQIPVGTTRKLIKLLAKTGIQNPKVIYFPENLRLGKGFETFLNPDRIILGSDNVEAFKNFKKDFSFIKSPVITMGVESAEMVKHALNSYLATCISLSSEISDLSEKTGANMVDVVKALKTDKRVSKFAPLDPGLGFAGGTLGRDIQSLRRIAKTKKYKSKLLDAVYIVNSDRLSLLLDKIRSFYPTLKDKTIGILGLTYKENTNTLRRSMSLQLASILKSKGALLKTFDPAIKGKITNFTYLNNCSKLETFFKNLDLIVVMTPWPEFKKIDPVLYSPLVKRKVIIDTKNFLDLNLYRNSGFTYLGMGIS